VASGNQRDLVGLYRRTTSLVAVAAIPGGLTLAAFAGVFILAWTGSVPAAQQAGVAAAFLLGGQVLQALSVVPFYLALAHGNIRLNLQIGIASVVLIAPLLGFLVTRYGIVGAGVSWLVMNVCTLPPYMYFLHRRFLPGEFRQWCLRGVGCPLLAALPCVLLGRWLVPHTDSRLLTMGWIGLVWGVAVAAAAMSVPELRNALMKRLSRICARFLTAL
jgi:O-antigen/teichoic acid export membrane protein